MALRDESRLTELAHGAGCGCKIGAQELRRLLDLLPRSDDPRLLVGADTSDDAAVYGIGDGQAVIHTVDFFTPIVDDPFDFGRVAATNALSDVYAMGGRPLVALNLVAFSLEQLGAETLGAVLRGGAEVASRAGAALGGGHSIDDREPKYGMAVVGMVATDDLITNAGGEAGDILFLTKPLGAGLIATAAKRGLASDELIDRGVAVMTELNASAAAAARAAGAYAMTDVTGFGLAGHLHELCRASGVEAEVESELIPAIPGTLELAADPRCIAGGSRRNAAHAEEFVTWDGGVDAERRVLACDAMTSGGLLVAVPEANADRAPGRRIGRLVAGEPGRIVVT